ncbi:MAG: MurR/RpiR family transcriptional regulator [Clostridiales bacterium]|nr:MurR/RpiR family transcriptional regulator [Clostridiales bacterium]
MDFYQIISDKRSNLNANEEDLLNYMLKHSNDIGNISIRHIAKDNFTVPNSITRVCNKLGFSGFSQFRDSLIKSNNRQTSLEMSNLCQDLVRTQTMINDNTLNIVAKCIHICDKINVFGFGLSRFVSQEFFSRLVLSGNNGQFFDDVDVASSTINMIRRNEIGFFISNSGESPEILQIANLAKSTPLTIVSITGFSNNQLSNISDHQFYGINNPLLLHGIDIANRISLSYICDTIINKVLQHKMDNIAQV